MLQHQKSPISVVNTAENMSTIENKPQIQLTDELYANDELCTKVSTD